MAKATRTKVDPIANGTAHSYGKRPSEMPDDSPPPVWQFAKDRSLPPGELAKLALSHEYLQELGVPVDEERFDRMVDLAKSPQVPVPNRDPQPSRQVTVYYIRVGPYIKIGQTRDLKRRLSAYPPETVVLATETGLRDVLEPRRHQQFKDDCIGQWRREWFFPSPILIAHINTLRDKPLSPAELAG